MALLPPSNLMTVEIAPITAGTIGTYASAGNIQQATAWPVRVTESEGVLIFGDTTRTEVEQPTHMTLGTFEAINTFGDAFFAAIKAYDDLDGTNYRKKECAIRVTWPDVDPAGTNPTAVIEGWIKQCAPEPPQDGKNTSKFKWVMQATKAPVWTNLPA